MVLFIQRNGALVGGILLSAIVFLAARPVFENDRGSYVPAMLQAASPVLAVLIMVLCTALATGIGIAVARLTNACVSLFVIGVGLYALDYRLGTTNEILLAGALGRIPIELFLWFVLMLGSVIAIFQFGGPLRDVHPNDDGESPSPFTSPDALKSAAAGLLVLPAVWILAVSELSGQGVGAVFIGALLAGLIGRLVAPHVQPVLLFASPLLFAAIGTLIGVIVTDGEPGALFVDQALPAPLRPAPLDYVVGCLAGVAVGYGWARSFLHHEDSDAEAAVR